MRRPLFALGLLLLIGCSAERRNLEELQRAGYQHLQAGDLPAAEARANEGMRRARERRDAPWEWRFQVLRAEVLGARGRYAEAMALLGRPNRSGAPDAADVRALVARSRARCLSPDGVDSFSRAEADLADAQTLADTLGSSELGGEVALCRGTCAAFGGDVAAAESRYREALDAARRVKDPFLEARAAGNLGLLRCRTGRYDDGADWLKKSIDLAAQVGAHRTTEVMLHNLGWCYFNLGDYDRALGFLSRAESLAAERGFADDLHHIFTIVGNAHVRLGDLSRAGNDYLRALKVARELGNRGQTAKVLANLAFVAAERAQYDEAERYNEEALQIERELGDLAGMQDSLLTSANIWAGRGEHRRAESIYRDVIRSPHTETEVLWHGDDTTRGVDAIVVPLVKMERPAEADAEFGAAFALMESSRALLHTTEPRISFFASLRRFHDGYVAFLVDHKRERGALEVADRGRALRLRELGTDTEISTVDHFQKTAAAIDAVLLFYWLAPARSFLWVVTPRNVELHALPGVAEIQAHVESHQARVLRSRDPLEEGAPDAEWLYDKLVRPAEASIPAGSRVVIAPDGPLHQINFETLVVASGKRHYWIEDVILATAPSLALLSASKDPGARPPAQRLLIIGDPAPADAEFPPLPQTANEVRLISDQFAPADRLVYTGLQAEPSAYRRSEPAGFSFIHFAAHAQANAEVPLDSAVILSARNDAYKLYAHDIAEVALHADVVTLSACRGAGSRAYAGEGLVGLAWAFLGSGARNVIAGLWDVADTSTPALMEGLYRGLRRGLPPAEALRGAKLAFLGSGTAYRKPFYWAPFVVYTRGLGAMASP